MIAKTLAFLLIACRVILNESSVVIETWNRAGNRVTSTLPDGYTHFSAIHTSYKVHNVSKSWNDARDLCISEGARLAIADSMNRIAHISTLSSTNPWKWLHVGFYKINQMINGTWYRVDNDEPVRSLPWRGGARGWYDNCTGISLHRDGLIAYSCDTTIELPVCEIPDEGY